MILFFNTFITDKTFSKADRGLLPQHTPLEIFKYSLASLAVIPWTKVVIYFELDDPYKKYMEETVAYIASLFPQVELYLRRNDRHPMWIAAIEKLLSDSTDELIYFSCNHDHIFIDHEVDFFQQVESSLKKLGEQYEYLLCTVSHWPEYLGYRSNPIVYEDEVLSAVLAKNDISIQIVNRGLLKKWFLEKSYGDVWMPRSDGVVESPETCCTVPRRELVRHFDTYLHAGIDNNICPPMFIPAGFFEKEMTISLYERTRRQGAVWIHPAIEKHTSVDTQGVDLRIIEEDLPLFWKGHIAGVHRGSDNDYQAIVQRRNEYMLLMANQCSYQECKDILPALRLTETGELERLTAYHQKLIRRDVIEPWFHHLYVENRSKDSLRGRIVRLTSENETLRSLAGGFQQSLHLSRLKGIELARNSTDQRMLFELVIDALNNYKDSPGLVLDIGNLLATSHPDLALVCDNLAKELFPNASLGNAKSTS